MYLLTSSASPQTGAVEPLKTPQSSMTALSLPDSGFVVSESVGVPRVSVKAPLSVPVLAMSTVPSAGASPGRRPEAVRIAVLDALLDIASVPVLNVLAAFADDAGKSAPEATVTPTAARTVARAASARRG